MNMHDTDFAADDLHQAAAHWHLRLREAPDEAALREGLGEWLGADDAHRLAYADVCAAAFACEQLAPAEDAAHGPPLRLRQPVAAPPPRRRRLRVAAALAASLLALALLPGLSLQLRADYLGQPGQVVRHTLEDGSVLSLDGASAVRVRYAGAMRHVELLRGALHVDVRPDPDRPFVVSSGGLEARALGTRYAVAQEREARRVAVEHGRVAVRLGDGEAVELAAGQMLLAAATDAALHITDSGPTDSGWMHGQLVFSATPFEQAVAAMARHLPERVVLAQIRDGAAVTAVAPQSEARTLLERLGRERGYRSTRIPGLLIVLY
jgi:transmembrane sensor